MHRTLGDGYVLEGGLRRFIDQAEPVYPGTVDTAEYNNAVQEEICNVIEAVGLVVYTDDVTDRAAGWNQLYTAIFESSAIDTAAIDNISLDVLSAGDLDITIGDYNVVLNESGLTFVYSSGVTGDFSAGGVYLEDGTEYAEFYANELTITKTASRYTQLMSTGIAVNFDNEQGFLGYTDVGQLHSGKGISSRMNYQGLLFFGSGHPNGETVYVRYNITEQSMNGSGITWTHVGGGQWYASGPLTTTIPTSCSIKGVFAHGESTFGGIEFSTFASCGVSEDAGFVTLWVRLQLNTEVYPPNTNTVRLTVVFDGQSL